MEYNFTDIERRAKEKWQKEQVYKIYNNTDKPKYYVLDMFPYPSGAGLHVGHPLGYIASDIFARYKRLKGFNVLHPMGFDEFGLPAEQYALETGQHPAITTANNIARYREQLDNIGFSFDWDRKVNTSDPKYYKWTQWIFLQLFNSWYDKNENHARPIKDLIEIFEKSGNKNIANLAKSDVFDASRWNGFDEIRKREVLMSYRLAYLAFADVWWCEALGTVLANDEVVNGVSERGGHPVEKKQMRQWFLRITEFAERLLESLDTLDWSDAMKEMQRNWIGKSVGAEVRFALTPVLSKGEGENMSDSKGANDALLEKKKSDPGFSWQTADITAYHSLSQYQNDLKNNLTESENILWQELRGQKLGFKFRRQHVIGKYIVDFICLPEKLIVEIDGEIHNIEKEKDAERTTFLEGQGYKVIRFTNNEVLTDIEGVLKKIKHSLTPALSEEEGEKTYYNKSEAHHTPLSLGDTSLSPGEGRGEAIKGSTEIETRNTSLSPGEGRGEAIKGSTEIETRNTSLSFGEGRGEAITVFTTRPDTIFGVDFMVLAPEHTLVESITTPDQKDAIDQYVKYVKSRSERERISEVKQVTGCFTGAYAIHPFTEKSIPIWISEYVLAGYGTGAIMAVPSGDERDHAFAKHFNIPITNIFGSKYPGEAAYSDKTGIIENSGFLSGMSVPEASEFVIKTLEDLGIGKRRVNYKLRDAGFSRQRYWGEPFPVVYIDDVPYGIDEVPELEKLKFNELPVELPKVDKYSPGPEGQGPLANLTDWVNIGLTPALNGEGDATQGNGNSKFQLHNGDEKNETRNTSLSFGEGRGEAKGAKRETNTMPGYAGSSWYFLRYMDPDNDNEFASRDAIDYWQQVDLYVGGTEHAVGHLLYARMWTKALYDLGYIGFDEPFKKLLNQGMIQGMSYFIEEVIYKNVQDNYGSGKLRVVSINKGSKLSDYFEEDGNEYAKIIIRSVRIKNGHNYVDSKNRLTKQKYEQHLKDDFSEISEKINIENELKNFVYEQEKTENGEDYIQCKMEIEKMSKSKYNVVNPDDIVAQYGADTFRMYEMFLGPVEMSKPWDTKGIEGVHRFLKKMWRLYHGDAGWIVNDELPTDAELRILHKTIKKVSEDIEKFSFNTTVSQFMITVNELTDLNCHKRAILEPLAILICPFAPHFAEELWQQLGNTGSVVAADFPRFEAKFIEENTKMYPVAINGKTRTEIEFALDADPKFIENEVLADLIIQKWLEGKEPKKFIYVKGKMINLVV